MPAPAQLSRHDTALAAALVALVALICVLGGLSGDLVHPATGTVRTAAAVLATLVGCAVVAWRQVVPLAVLAAVMMLSELTMILDSAGSAAAGFASTAYAVIGLPWLLTLYTAAVVYRATVSAPVTTVVGALSAVSLVVHEGASGETAWLTAFVAAVLLVVWLLGRAGRRHQRRHREMAQRMAGLSHEQARVRAAERARLARELHDVAAHHLSSIVVTVGAAERLVVAEPARALEAARFAAETGLRTQEALRQMVQAMAVEPGADARPVSAHASLHAIDTLVEQFSRVGLPVRMRVHGYPVAMHPDVALATYRVVQEGLTNALRHAAATLVAVDIEHAEGQVRLTVADDGPGTAAGDGPPAPRAGYGLTGMRERVHAVGGDVDAGPGPHGGWRLTARMPEVPPGWAGAPSSFPVRRSWVDPVARRRREWIGDGVLAALLSIVALMSWVGAPPVLLLALAHTAALAWRRRAPWAVLTAVVLAHATWLWVGPEESGASNVMALLVALWTVGTRCRPVSLSHLSVLPAAAVLGVSLERFFVVGAGGPGVVYEAMAMMYLSLSLLWGAGVGWGLLRDPTGGFAGAQARADQALAEALTAEREHVAGALRERVQCHVTRLVSAAEQTLELSSRPTTEPSAQALQAALSDVRSEGRKALAAMRSLLGLLRTDDNVEADDATLAPPRRMAEQFTGKESAPSLPAS